MFSHLTRCAADTPAKDRKLFRMLLCQHPRHIPCPHHAMLLLFLSNLIKNCYFFRGPFSFARSLVVFLTYMYFFIALIIFILCGFRATCYAYSEGVAAAAAAEVLGSLRGLFDFSQVIA